MKIYRILVLFLLLSKVHFPQQYELKSIEYEGNNEFSSSTLTSVILSEESPGWFYKFLNSFTPLGAPIVYFDSLNIPIDLNSIRFFYNANGFFKAKISYKYDIDTSSGSVHLTYTIQENRPSDYNNLRFFGADMVPGHIITYMVRAFSIDTTNRYNQDYIQTKTEEALNILLNNGFIYAAFDSLVVYKDTINNNADLNYKFEGRNAAFYAVTSGDLDLVKYFFQITKVKINAADQEGRTLLSYAAATSNPEIISYLIEKKKAKANKEDKWGKTPLDYAWNIEVIEYFKAKNS